MNKTHKYDVIMSYKKISQTRVYTVVFHLPKIQKEAKLIYKIKVRIEGILVEVGNAF